MNLKAPEPANIFSKMTPEKRAQLIGEIVMLMAASPVHRNFPILDLMDIVLAPVNLNQFRIYHDKDKKPIGLVTWGHFTQETLDRYLSGDVALSQDEWKKGDRLVFTDLIAPYGHAKTILADLRKNIFPDAFAYSIRFDTTGAPRRKIRHWYGVNALKAAGNA